MSLLLQTSTTPSPGFGLGRTKVAPLQEQGHGFGMGLDILDVLNWDLEGREECGSGDGEGSSRSTAQSTKSGGAKSSGREAEGAVLLFPNLVAPQFAFDRTAPLWEFGKRSTPNAAAGEHTEMKWFGMYSWDELEEWMDAGIGGMDRSVLLRSAELNITAPLAFSEIQKSHEKADAVQAPPVLSAPMSKTSTQSHDLLPSEDVFSLSAAGALLEDDDGLDPLAGLSDALVALTTEADQPNESSSHGINPNAPAWQPPAAAAPPLPRSRPTSLSRMTDDGSHDAPLTGVPTAMGSRPMSLGRSSLGRSSAGRPASQGRASLERGVEDATAPAEWGFNQNQAASQGWGDACYGEVVGQPIHSAEHAFNPMHGDGYDLDGYALREDPWATAELVKIMKMGEVPLPAPPAVIAAHLASLPTPDDVRYFLQSELGPHPIVGVFYDTYIGHRFAHGGRGGYRGGHDVRGQRNKRRGGGKHRDPGAPRRAKHGTR